ncbi:MAG: hypothetical protein DMF68_20095 [Acidobacteria bacterium]|nr:MAG: hypothetical protein DMF68_20095 [Acidobacteriota bacterium]
MKKVYRILGLGLLLALTATSVLAQRPRTTTNDNSNTSSTTAAKPAPAPQTFNAKYEGGIFGYTKKEEGTLSFDDANKRLVFRNKEQKEILSIPYSAIDGEYADTKALRPKAATAATYLPFPFGLPAYLIKKKYQYLTMQFKDKDTQAAGITSFKVDNKELLASVLSSLADKAGLEPRGDGYVRKVNPTTP